MAEHKPSGTHDERQAAYALEVRAKYTQAEVDALGEKGHAFKNPDGSYSYPIDDLEDLRNAIHAVGRGNADHDALRKYIIGRAGALSATDEIPENWNSDGSLKDAKTAANARVEVRKGREEMRGGREARVSPRSAFELREVPNGTGGTNLRFTGFASVTGVDYEMEDWIGPWLESVTPGAFRKTLSEGADAAFLLNHEGLTLARVKSGTLKLSEETDPAASPIQGITGLYSEALLDPQNMYVQAMRSAVDRGDLDEMSFAFRVIRDRWSFMEDNGDVDRRWINEVSLDKGDVSLVNFAANPTTGGTVTLRQRLFGRGDTRERERLFARLGISCQSFAGALVEVRSGNALSQASLDVLQPILDDLAAIDKLVDADQPRLAELLGVANPDEPEAEPDADDTATRIYVLPNAAEAAWVELARMRGSLA